MNKRQKKKMQKRYMKFRYDFNNWGWNFTRNVRISTYTHLYVEILSLVIKEGQIKINPMNIRRAGRYILKVQDPIRNTSKAFSDKIGELIKEQNRLECIKEGLI